MGPTFADGLARQAIPDAVGMSATGAYPTKHAAGYGDAL
jgi:hypothetical protein